jgi:hypothetical protein
MVRCVHCGVRVPVRSGATLSKQPCKGRAAGVCEFLHDTWIETFKAGEVEHLSPSAIYLLKQHAAAIEELDKDDEYR